MSASALDCPGFADPVADAQVTFRAVLDAMAHPGRILTIAARLRAPAPLDAATAAVALTLLDQETTIFLDPHLHGVAAWLAFHAGAAAIADAGHADFLLARAWPGLDHLRAGSDEAPEEAATVILQLPALGQGARYRLAGPGLAAPALLQADGLPADFSAQWRRNHARFPRGVDLVLCAGDRLAALPRSVTVEPA